MSLTQNSLGAIATCIQNQETMGMELDFERAITLIQFTIKLDILQATKNMYFSDLIRVEVEVEAG